MKYFLALVSALACLATAAASAQTTPDVARASRALAAIWRPIAADAAISSSAIEIACVGATDEITAMEALIPAVITTESLARVRGIHGLTIIPAESADAAFFFPPRDMMWFASGMGLIAVQDEPQGLLGVRDAAGASIGLQLGRAGATPVLRVRSPQGLLATFVGCASTNAD